jgi:formylglycine-generating enzyme required for sulfatase activity
MTLLAFLLSSALAAPVEFRDCADCPVIVTIPAGRATLGSPPGETLREDVPENLAARERVRHEVVFARPFALGKFEVTRGQYARLVAATGHAGTPGCFIWDFTALTWSVDPNKSWREPGFVQRDDEPVICVSIADAEAYAAWLSRATGLPYRLPSEAEWEYAARAGTTTARHWGDGRAEACDYANVYDRGAVRALDTPAAQSDADHFFPCDDGHIFTAPVGTYRANRFGLHDMIGNVWEWVADCFHDTYEGAPADGSAWMTGPCRYRGDRGAGWNFKPRTARSAFRGRPDPDRRDTDLGFRVARDLPPGP